MSKLVVNTIEPQVGFTSVTFNTNINTTSFNVTGISTFANIDVNGSLDLDGTLNVTGVSTISVNSASDALRITQTGTGNALVVEDSANPDATAFIIDNAGKLGVGTDNPNGHGLSLYDSSLQLITSGEGGGFFGGLTLSYESAFDAYYILNWFKPLYIGGGDDVILQNNANNVGIGTDNPTKKLDVEIQTASGAVGSVLNSHPIAEFINSSAGVQRGLEIGAPPDGFLSPVYLKVSGTSSRFAILDQSNDENFTILNNGNVGIGSTIPTAKLDVNGTLNVTGVSTIGVSDKQIIFTTDGGLGAIQSASSSGLKIQRGTIDTININSGQVTVANHNLKVNNNSIVGSAITMYGATGIVSATAFYGDGSNLSGVAGELQVTSKTSAYTLTSDDANTLITITTGGITVPASVFSTGQSVLVYNNSASSQTITQGASVTLRLAGTSDTGNRTLEQRGLSTILCVASNEFVVTGSGLL